MKIIGINSSPKGNESNTLQLVKSVLKGAESEGAETELVDLYKLHIEYCTGCGACYATGECPLFDDFTDLFDRIMNSDGIVLGAPNYINSVPAPMKAFFDRLSDAIHCQMLTGKFGCSVCTAGGSGEDEVYEIHERRAHESWRYRCRRHWSCGRERSLCTSEVYRTCTGSWEEAGKVNPRRNQISRPG